MEKYGISVYSGLYDIESGKVDFTKIVSNVGENEEVQKQIEEMRVVGK